MRTVRAPELALLAMTVAWGFSFVVVPWTLESGSAMACVTARAAVGFAVLCAVRPAAVLGTALEWKVGLLGGLFLAGGYVLQTEGLRGAGAGQAGFLTAFYIPLVPAIEAGVYRRSPAARDLAAIAVATAGIGLLVVDADLTLTLSEILVAASAPLWAAQIVLVGRVAQRVDPLRIATIQMLVLGLASGVAAAAADELRADWSARFVLWTVFLGVVTNALAFLVQAWAQRRVSPTRAAVIFSTEPLFATAFGVWLLGERLRLRDYAGASLVLVAVAFTVWAPRRAASAPVGADPRVDPR